MGRILASRYAGRVRLLPTLEALFVASFVVLAALSVRKEAPPLPAIDVEALSAGPAEEYWMGLFLNGQHVGYSVSREAGTADGGRVFSQKSSFRMGAMDEDGQSDERPDPQLDDERRRYYRLTAFGERVAQAEAARLATLLNVAQSKRIMGGVSS